MTKLFFALYLPLLLLYFLGDQIADEIQISMYGEQIEQDLLRDDAGIFILAETLYPSLSIEEWHDLEQ